MSSDHLLVGPLWGPATETCPVPRETLPTMYELPSEDPEEPGLPDEFHLYQPQLLRETFRPPHYPTEGIFTGSDINLYYDVRHLLWHKRPDWFSLSSAYPSPALIVFESAQPAAILPEPPQQPPQRRRRPVPRLPSCPCLAARQRGPAAASRGARAR